MSVSRRQVLASATLGLALHSLRGFANVSLPFHSGDVVVGCTLLNDPNDDHRGRGRLLHYDAQLQLKQTIWLDQTTHIVQGVRCASNGILWAFDAFAYQAIWLDREGKAQPTPSWPKRSFAHVNFAQDGRYFLGENFVGERSRVPLKTTLPFLPGTRRYGDGFLYEFSPEHDLIHVHKTPVHGGMGGFQGLTSSVLADSDRLLIYTSESGPRIMRWDLANRRPLPDLITHSDDSGRMFFEVRPDEQGNILVLTGLQVERYDLDGKLLNVLPLGSFGWASMSQSRAGKVYLSNFFSGQLACLDLQSGQIIARAETGMRKSASGLDTCP